MRIGGEEEGGGGLRFNAANLFTTQYIMGEVRRKRVQRVSGLIGRSRDVGVSESRDQDCAKKFLFFSVVFKKISHTDRDV